MLLADEPTGNLDPQTAHYVFDALEALVRQSGLAALIATHIDLGLPEAEILDLTPYRAGPERRDSGTRPAGFNEAFA